MGDFNDYILGHRSCQCFSKIGLRELITNKHLSEGPGSTRSNRKKNAIDGIWVSPGLTTTSCGYLRVNYGLKLDYILIWVKISLANAMGDKNLLSKKPSTCRICLHYPEGQQKYISKLIHITRQHNLLPILRAL